MYNIDKIKRMAKEKGIKIKYICAQLGLSETYLSNVKNGRDHMTDERLAVIADILGTTVAYLNDETDTPSPKADFTPYSLCIYGSDGLITKKVLSPEQIELVEKLVEQLR